MIITSEDAIKILIGGGIVKRMGDFLRLKDGIIESSNLFDTWGVTSFNTGLKIENIKSMDDLEQVEGCEIERYVDKKEVSKKKDEDRASFDSCCLAVISEALASPKGMRINMKSGSAYIVNFENVGCYYEKTGFIELNYADGDESAGFNIPEDQASEFEEKFYKYLGIEK